MASVAGPRHAGPVTEPPPTRPPGAPAPRDPEPPGPSADERPHGDPAREDPPPQQNSRSWEDTLRGIDLRRSPDRWIGGVAAGLARRLGIDPVIVRAGFVVLGLVLGIGIVVYLLAWLLVPDDTERSHLELAVRHGEGASWALLVLTAVVTVGVLIPDEGQLWLGPWDLGWLLVLLLTASLAWLAVWALWTLVRRRPVRGGAPDREGEAAVQAPVATSLAPPGPSEATTESVRGAPDAPRPPGTPPPTRTSRAPRPPRPPRRPRRAGPGPLGALLVVGLALIGGGLAAWAAPTLGGNPIAVVTAVVLATLGLSVLALGVAGRRSGFTGFLAVLALLATLVTAPLPPGMTPTWRMGVQQVTPVTAAQAADLHLAAGELDVDLRALDPAVVPEGVRVEVGLGMLRVIVPDDLTVRVRARVGGGQLIVRGPSELGFGRSTSLSTSGVDVDREVVLGPGPVDLDLDLQTGVGEVVVERSSR